MSYCFLSRLRCFILFFNKRGSSYDAPRTVHTCGPQLALWIHTYRVDLHHVHCAVFRLGGCVYFTSNRFDGERADGEHLSCTRGSGCTLSLLVAPPHRVPGWCGRNRWLVRKAVVQLQSGRSQSLPHAVCFFFKLSTTRPESEAELTWGCCAGSRRPLSRPLL